MTLQLSYDTQYDVIDVKDSKGGNVLIKTFYSQYAIKNSCYTFSTTSLYTLSLGKHVIVGVTTYVDVDVGDITFSAAIQNNSYVTLISNKYGLNLENAWTATLFPSEEDCSSTDKHIVNFKKNNEKIPLLPALTYTCVKKTPIILTSEIYDLTCTGSSLTIRGYNAGEYTEVLVIWGNGKVTLTPLKIDEFTITLEHKCCGKARATLINSSIYSSLNNITCFLNENKLT